MSLFDCDLLVVGLGPVGDVLAGLARLQGLSVIAIEKEAEVYPLPRAAVFDHEIMRIFQRLGMADRIAGLCRVPDRYEFLNGAGDILLEFDLSPHIRDSGWAESYMLHQPTTERALRERIAELGVEIRRGARYRGHTQDATSVTAAVDDEDGRRMIRARYMVGCDGGSSAVRQAIGASLFDYGFEEPWLVFDTLADADVDLPMTLRQICDPHRPFTYMPLCGQRFRWEFMIRPGESAADLMADDTIRTLISPWVDVDRLTIERKAVYTFHGLVANRWRDRRALIAGDAAHQMPPFAGQGMCSGIRDASNLAWKLGEVIRTGADDDILDSYQAEREPHVRAIIEIAIAMGRTICILDPAAAAARDAEMLAQRAGGGQAISVRYPDLEGGTLLLDTPFAGALLPQPLVAKRRMDDVLLGQRAALIGRGLSMQDDDRLVTIDIDGPAAAGFGPAIAAWLDRTGSNALLVRPDRHIFGVGDATMLRQQWHARLGGRQALAA